MLKRRRYPEKEHQKSIEITQTPSKIKQETIPDRRQSALGAFSAPNHAQVGFRNGPAGKSQRFVSISGILFGFMGSIFGGPCNQIRYFWNLHPFWDMNMKSFASKKRSSTVLGPQNINFIFASADLRVTILLSKLEPGGVRARESPPQSGNCSARGVRVCVCVCVCV